jgi:hypothetical protein
MATKKTATPVDAGRQLIVNFVCAHVEYYLDRQRGAGHTPEEITQQRAALVAGITAALRIRSFQP